MLSEKGNGPTTNERGCPSGSLILFHSLPLDRERRSCRVEPFFLIRKRARMRLRQSLQREAEGFLSSLDLGERYRRQDIERHKKCNRGKRESLRGPRSEKDH